MTAWRIRMGAFVLSATLAGCGQSESGTTEAPPPLPSLAAASGGGASPTDPVALDPATAGAIRSTAPPASVEMPDPIVRIRTSLGNIYIRLYAAKAKRTVANFVDYVMTGHYDGTIFHQVESGYAVMGGGYDDKLQAKPARYPIRNEADNGLKNVRGTVAMARDPSDPHSATSQFFINLVDNPKLDHAGPSPETFGYCVFGEVVEGLDVVEKIAAQKTASVRSFDKLPMETVLVDHVRFVR